MIGQGRHERILNCIQGQNAMLDFVFSARPTCALQISPYNKSVGQQHRARSKRKRRKAYLKRKKKATRSKRRESPKPRGKKEPAAAQ